MPSPSRYYSSTAAKTTLSVAIDSASTSLQIATASGLPSQYPFTLILEKDTANEEIVNVTALVGTAYTIARGQDGTTAKAHNIGAIIEHGVSARDFTESRAHEVASTAHNVTGDVVGTGGAQTLTSKTLTSPTINGGTITTATHAGGTLSGSFTSTATITGGTITGATITGLSSAGMVDSSATPKNYVDSILGSAIAASTSAASAATSATAAATSAASALTSQTAAATSAASALASQTAAATSAASALTSQTAAATSAASALTSQTAAATSATSAAASATAAATSATSAANSATTAAASVATIAGYATTASNSASAASTSAASAAASATAASTSATSADSAASIAIAQASNASGSATAAATSATSAAASATAAATSATSAAASATAAATSATSAAASATSAAASWDLFDDRYLGAKSTPPALDNDGNPLATGAIYFYTVDNNMYAWNGTSWSVFTSASAITTIAASSPLTGGGSGGTVTVSIQDATTAQKGAVQLVDSVTSTSTSSAATPNSVKQAYDLAATALAGLHFHDPVETASSANITLSGLYSINGYTPSDGERVLVKSQTTQSENGIYNASSSTWTRSSDFNSWDEVYTSAVYVKQGNESGESFITTVASTGTIDVTAITWALFATDAVYSAGTGLTLVGTTFALDTTTQYVVPSQSGQTGKYLTTNGTTSSWGTISGGVTLTELEEVEQQIIMGAYL